MLTFQKLLPEFGVTTRIGKFMRIASFPVVPNSNDQSLLRIPPYGCILLAIPLQMSMESLETDFGLRLEVTPRCSETAEEGDGGHITTQTKLSGKVPQHHTLRRRWKRG